MITNFKNFIIENNLPKGIWVKATEDELDEYNDEILDMINKTYDYLGGHPGFNTADDINFNKADEWEIIDLTGDDEPDAVSADKIKLHGKKYTLGANDGEKQSKIEYIQMMIDRLHKPGNYVECSYKLANFLIKNNAPIVTDKKNIEKILSKEVKMVNNGWYEREINGKRKLNILLGKPLVK